MKKGDYMLNKLDEFFEFIRNSKSEIELAKKRGLNDYNPLTEVLKSYDEVRLHSGILASFLNPNGKHYQDDLFLKIFLKNLDIDFEFDTKNTILKKEYHSIDIYLTDGSKYIIIENKIYAQDQSCQITRYVENLKQENVINDEDILVLYLTNQDKNCPSSHHCQDGYIIPHSNCSKAHNINFKIKYKKLSYSKDILNWLIESQKEIRNITNLNIAFEYYIQVVKKITKKFKGNIMDIYEKILENPEYSYLALEINQKKIKIELVKQLFDDIENDFSFFRYFDNFEIIENANFNQMLNDFFNKQKNRKKDFGKIYNLKNEYKLLFFIGTERFHYGIIKVKNNQVENLENLVKLKNKWEYRNWSKIKFFSNNLIKLYPTMNLDTIKKITIEKEKFLNQIKREVNIALQILEKI